jgi:hypothetical protein
MIKPTQLEEWPYIVFGLTVFAIITLAYMLD